VNRLEELDELLRFDPADAGCDAGTPILDEYVQIELAGGDPGERFPGTAAHLRTCSACRADHDTLLEVARDFPASAPNPRD
jgi:hypothetical protein